MIFQKCLISLVTSPDCSTFLMWIKIYQPAWNFFLSALGFEKIFCFFSFPPIPLQKKNWRKQLCHQTSGHGQKHWFEKTCEWIRKVSFVGLSFGSRNSVCTIRWIYSHSVAPLTIYLGRSFSRHVHCLGVVCKFSLPFFFVFFCQI